MSNSTVYFIDSGVADYQTLMTGLPEGSLYYLLDLTSDGLVQISNILNLAGINNLGAIQILSHGSSGTLYLGNATLNNASIDTYSNLLSSIGSHLSETGDLLLYGCDVAQGDEGQKFINTLAAITGADVAASTNLTGNSNLGGDWVLEKSTGLINAQFIQSNSYQHVLDAVITGTVGVDTLLGGAGNDTITGLAGNDSMDGQAGSDFIDGGDGNDTILGGAGDDTLIDNQGANYIDGGAGADTLTSQSLLVNSTMLGSIGNDTLNGAGASMYLDGGADNDTLNATGYVASLGTYVNSGQATLIGGLGNDSINATLLKNALLQGSDGNDILNAGGENRGVTNATLEGGNGDDQLNLVYAKYTDPLFNVTLGTPSNYVLNGDGGNDILLAKGPARDMHGQVNIAMSGGAGDDVISLLDDSILYRQIYGSNYLGGVSQATLSGGDGNDTITASGVLNLTMSGGLGVDTFNITTDQYKTLTQGAIIFTTDTGVGSIRVGGYDITGPVTVTPTATVITDFTAGTGGDVLNITELLQNSAVGYDGTNPFATGHLQLLQSGSDTLLQFDADGSGNVNSMVTIALLNGVNVNRLNSSNFEPGFGTSNNAPILDSTLSRQDTMFEDGISSVVSFSYFNMGRDGSGNLVDGVTDVETPSNQIGIAITNIVGVTAGTVEYSRDAGVTWVTVPPVALSEQNALLFLGTDLLRYTPPENANGDRTITFHAWDGTGGYASGDYVDLTIVGTGGSTPFSVATATETLTITAVNDAPTLDGDVYKIEVINEGYINAGAINVAIQSDGKFILVGNGLNESTLNTDVILTRINTDGSLDTTFGLNGTISADWGGDDASRIVKLQPDGKILVAGTSDSIFTIARYDTNGLIDTSFGLNGLVQYDLFTYGNQGKAQEITLQDDGKILITANTALDQGGEFVLYRLNQDGSLDNSFANNGFLTSNLLGQGWLGYPVVTTVDGKIIVGGDGGVSLIKYNIDGSIDTSFADNGILVDSNVWASVTAIQILGDGSILVAGITGLTPGQINNDVFLAHYDMNGVLDTSFGQNGYVIQDIGGWEHVDDLLIDSVGNIFIYGATNTNSEYTGSGYRFVISYNADGSINPQFGLDGVVELTNWNEGIAIQSDGKLVIPTSNNGHLAIERLNVDGSKDFTFGDALDINSIRGYMNEGDSVPTLPFSIFANLVGAIDADGDSIGIVITSLDSLENDAFEYSTDNGNTWHLIDGSVISEINAQVFSRSDVFRYTPQPNSNGIHQFTFRAWDGGGGYSTGDFVNITVTGVGGSSPFSETVATHTQNVIPLEDEATATLNVTGAAEEGGSLVAALTNVLDEDGSITSTAYQWQENTGTALLPVWVDLASQTSAMLSIPSDQSYVGKSVRVLATTTDSLGGTTTFSSDAQTITNINDAPTFMVGDGDGIVTTSIGTSSGAASMTLQPDGKILVAGSSYNLAGSDFTLVRYNSNGSLDNTFSSDGIVTTAIGPGFDAANSITLQPDGKVLVAGISYIGVNHYFTLVRYNSDGSLDNTFSGNGIVTASIRAGFDYAPSITLQSDGKILVAGSSANGPGISSALILVRYNSDGSLDNTFSGDGSVTTSINGNDYATSITLQPDGKILVAGISFNGVNFYSILVRYNSDGSLDNTFSGDGSVTTSINGNDFATSITLQPDGKILVAGSSYNGTINAFALVRYNSDGSLDNTFSGDGIVTTSIGTDGSASAITLQPDGKILVAGYSVNGGNYDFTLVRFNSDGSLDNTFSGDGIVTTLIGTNDIAKSITLQPDGKILVAGYSSLNGGNNDFTLMRYNSDGSLDQTFDDSFTNSLDNNPNYTENSNAVILDNNVQIYDPELFALNSYANSSLTLARHNGANAEDLFSGSGIVSGQASGNVTVSNTTIGTYTWLSGTLTLSFNSSATQALVNQALQSIAYENTSDAPPATVQIDWTFNDGNTGAQGTGGALSVTGSTTVNITAVNDAPTGTVTITGTATQGQILTAANTLADLDGLGPITYTWFASGSNTAIGTGANYTLTQAEVGKTITVTASYTDGFNTTESKTSVATNVVVTTSLNLVGTPKVDTLTGGLLDETLTGLGSVDILNGGEGSDVYIMTLATDHPVAEINDTGVNGSDEVRFTSTTANQTLTLFAGDRGIEKVTIGTGTATEAVRTGTTALNVNAAAVTNALRILGNNGNNSLTGTAFNDTLDGGLGVDTLIGGAGDDTYLVDLNANGTLQDTITEIALATNNDKVILRGTSTNTSAATLTLAANLEQLDASSTGASLLNLTGNTANNRLTGNAANNILNGLAGADTMAGGAGNDTYVVDNVSDTVIENNNEGTDLVQVAIATRGGTFVLGNHIENATLTNTVAYSLTGNDLNNTLTGNAAANTLSGGAGNDSLNGLAGADTMIGGVGDDTYVVDNAGDIVRELIADAGTDLVQSSVTYSQDTVNAAGAENLTLTGTGRINGTGNGLNNTITGNSGVNILNGGAGDDTLIGGLGNDTLTGGLGADVFTFNTALNANNNRDTITDFISGTDKISLENAIMTGLGIATGALTADQFFASSTAVRGNDASDRIVYNTTSGALYYDADGSGSGAAVQIALIGATIHPTLTSVDFFIV